MAKVIHFEIPAEDPQKLVEFYEKTFNWKIRQWENEEYWLIEAGEKDEAGIGGAIYPKNERNTVINTIGVSNLDGAMEKIKANGGEILGEPQEIPKVGRMVYFRDPEGTVSGALEPTPM